MENPGKPYKSANRIRKSARNLAFGVAMQFCTALFNFILRTAIIKRLGLEYASLNGLFTEIVSIMMLAEMGIGSAITYSLYKPIATGDHDKLCELMTFFKKAYMTIALVVFASGLALTPVVHLLVTDIGFSRAYMRLVFMLFVTKTAVSYLFSYKSVMVTADQRSYLITVIHFATHAAASLASVAVIVITDNFTYYLLAQILFTLLGNLAISVKADRDYPFLKRSRALPKEERKKIFDNIRQIFVGKLSGTITSSTDNVLISVMIGTLSVGVYSNYALVVHLFNNFVMQAESALSASVGHMFAFESKTRTEVILRRLTFAMMAGGAVCACVLYGALTPFVVVWLGADYTLARDTVFWVALNFFFAAARSPLFMASNGAGLFKEGKYISIAGSSVNLIVSVVLAKLVGISGIFIGTSCTHIIQILLKTRALYKRSLELPAAGYYRMWGLWTALTCACMFLSSGICDSLSLPQSVPGLIARGLIGAVIPSAAILILFSRTGEFRYFINLGKNTLEKLKRRLKRA